MNSTTTHNQVNLNLFGDFCLKINDTQIKLSPTKERVLAFIAFNQLWKDVDGEGWVDRQHILDCFYPETDSSSVDRNGTLTTAIYEIRRSLGDCRSIVDTKDGCIRLDFDRINCDLQRYMQSFQGEGGELDNLQDVLEKRNERAILNGSPKVFRDFTSKLESKYPLSVLKEKVAKKKVRIPPPLDWSPEHALKFYSGETVLWVSDENGAKHYLPQVVLLGPNAVSDEAEVAIALKKENFEAPCPVREGLEYQEQIGKKPYSARYNARLVDWDSATQTLTFQGSCYLDFCQTNLALDLSTSSRGSLREEISPDGTLEPLSESVLANPAGINALVFSKDGHMIYQKRDEWLVVRPGELCSGFSGTIDKDDIENIGTMNPRLSGCQIVREGVEELGIRKDHIIKRRFLGIGRELIRGGHPDFFYATWTDMTWEQIRNCRPLEKEGNVFALYVGGLAMQEMTPSQKAKCPAAFKKLLQELKSKGDISVPFYTNLALWIWQTCPELVGEEEYPAS